VVASTDGGADGTVLAYSGGKGTALWTRSGNAALPLGVVHGRGAVGVMSFGFGPGLGLAAAAVGGTGTSLWSRTLPLPTSGSAAIEFGEAGDVDADHVTDLYADIAYTSATSAGHFADVISGRNGRTTGGRPMGAPLYASVDGHGDDFFVVTSVKRWSMAVYDGNSRHRLWTLSQKLSASRQFLISGAVGQLAGHPGRSLVLSQWDGHHTIVMALQGRSGRRLWSVVA
jgi:hypothetical protein